MKLKFPLLFLVTISIITGQPSVIRAAESSDSNILDKVANLYRQHQPNQRNSQLSPPLRNPFTPQLPVKAPAQPEPAPALTPPPGPSPQMRADPSPPRPIAPPSTRSIPGGTDTGVSPLTTSISSLNISGIVWNSERPQAIVNETVVSIGDTVNGLLIKDITEAGLIVVFGEEIANVPYKSVSLALPESSSSTPRLSVPRSVEPFKNLRTDQRGRAGGAQQ